MTGSRLGERAANRGGLTFRGAPASGAGSMLWSALNQLEPSMPMWLIIQLVSIAAMPAAYDMARDRGGSTTAWLNVALIIGPLALIALFLLGKRNSEAIRTAP
jgi:hypothetical protein